MSITSIAFIPARKGSKSVKYKNLKRINNKTLVEISIITAKKCKIFDQIILSSDSEKIIDIGKKHKISTVIRPKNLSSDKSSTESALIHALNSFNNENDANIVILQPTSPLRKVKTIKKFYNFCVKKKIKNALSVSSIDHNISKVNLKKLFNAIGPINLRRRQDREKFIFENGNLYFCKKKRVLKEKKIYNKIWNYFETDVYESLDINNHRDLNISKYLYGKI